MTETIKARRKANDARIHSHAEERSARFTRMMADGFYEGLTGDDAEGAVEDAIERMLDDRDRKGGTK